MSDYFTRTERQLVGAARAAQATEAQAPAAPVARRRWRPALIVLGVLVAAVPAGAAVGVWPRREPDGLMRLSPQTVVARGDNPEFGRWEGIVSQSDAGRCIGLRLIDPPGYEGGSLSEGCGAGSGAASLRGRTPARTAVFGLVSSRAHYVRLEARGLVERPVATYAVPSEGEAFYFVSTARAGLRDVRVVPLDASGAQAGLPLYAAGP